jgi:hypothetical protein
MRVIKSKKLKMGGAFSTYGGEKCTNVGWYIPVRNI